jgi:flagellar motor switch protein FliN/FliY
MKINEKLRLKMNEGNQKDNDKPSENNTEEKPPKEMQVVEDFDLNLLLDIPLEITVELGRTRIQIQELLSLEPGSTVSLSKLEGEPVDILANDKLIARGEVVLQNKKYGIRITEITSRMKRIKSLS